jgi:hypothetical protein
VSRVSFFFFFFLYCCSCGLEEDQQTAAYEITLLVNVKLFQCIGIPIVLERGVVEICCCCKKKEEWCRRREKFGRDQLGLVVVSSYSWRN